MESKTEIIEQTDGYKTTLYHFFDMAEPAASIIILHGMAEHHKRYLQFAEYLTRQNIDVYIYDHRGHGTDKQPEDLGYFGEPQGYERVIEDVLTVIRTVVKENRSDKLILMGHSMGSLIARNVIQKYDSFDGVVLCGSTHPTFLKTQFGLMLSSLIRLIYGPRHRSPFFSHIMLGHKAYRKLCTKTPFDWLSRNHENIKEYINDPFCGFVCTISFYHNLLKLVSYAASPAYMRKTRNDLPIFIISGDHDPVGGMGKEINRLTSLYKKWDYEKVTAKLYPDCRHELINEINSDEVMKDIVSWIVDL